MLHQAGSLGAADTRLGGSIPPLGTIPIKQFPLRRCIRSFAVRCQCRAAASVDMHLSLS